MSTGEAALTPPAGPWMTAVLSHLDRDTTAVRTHDEDWSGRELLGRAGGAARFLAGSGAAPGAPVPALVGSSAGSVALTLGGALTGHPLAPLGVRLSPAELVPLVGSLGSEVLVTDTANQALAASVATAAGARLAVYDTFPVAELDLVPTTVGTIVLVLHTSGTTGRPKAVPVRDAAVHHRTQAYRAELGLAPGELYCSAGAFHHTGGVGMCFVALASGAGIVPLTRFSADAWQAVSALAPTCALLVPTMIDLLLEAGALDAVALRALHYGTAPIHPETFRAALAVLPGTTFAQAFGMTEGGPITVLRHTDHMRALDGEPRLLASVGRALPGVDLRLDDVDADGVGEVVARAGQIFLPDPDGWLHTGDLGRVDGEGFLYLQGRRGDKIIRGGENIYPLEVERVLETHPLVREAAVVGVADRRWGQTLKAFVVPLDLDAPPEPAALAEFVAGRLARWKVPADWELLAELPRNPAGKLLRRLL